MSIGLYRIGYILKSPLDNCASDHFSGASWMQWSSGPITRFEITRPLDPGPGYRSKPWCTGKQLLSGFNPGSASSKLQAASLKRVIHSPVNNYEFKFDICRMILYMYICQLCPICCWFSLYWHNVSKSPV